MINFETVVQKIIKLVDTQCQVKHIPTRRGLITAASGNIVQQVAPLRKKSKLFGQLHHVNHIKIKTQFFFDLTCLT